MGKTSPYVAFKRYSLTLRNDVTGGIGASDVITQLVLPVVASIALVTTRGTSAVVPLGDVMVLSAMTCVLGCAVQLSADGASRTMHDESMRDGGSVPMSGEARLVDETRDDGTWLLCASVMTAAACLLASALDGIPYVGVMFGLLPLALALHSVMVAMMCVKRLSGLSGCMGGFLGMR